MVYPHSYCRIVEGHFCQNCCKKVEPYWGFIKSVERFNRTLIDMLAKTVELHKWQEFGQKVTINFVLFVYRSTVQESTGESPFRLLYGRDPKLPTEDALSSPDCTQIDLSYYKTEVSSNLTEAWKLAQERIKKVQTHQKKQHDKYIRNNKFSEGDILFPFDPSLKSGKAYKFAKPFCGPYKIVHLAVELRYNWLQSQSLS